MQPQRFALPPHAGVAAVTLFVAQVAARKEEEKEKEEKEKERRKRRNAGVAVTLFVAQVAAAVVATPPPHWYCCYDIATINITTTAGGVHGMQG